MKTIIVSEKPIAGEKIAEILSSRKYTAKKEKNAPYYVFDNKEFGKTLLIPLKGHISDVDFPKDAANWYKTPLKTLAKETPIVYFEKEKAIIDLLKKESKDANQVIIATDADREGESIGREAVVYAKGVNSKIDVKRAYFSAITKEEITQSFSDLKPLNYFLADAADARREIDLVWGAALTRFLSLSTKSTGKSFLSVGRVQSPTLAKIVEREFEIEGFKPTPYWEIEADLDKNSQKFTVKHKKDRFLDSEDAKKAFDKLGDLAKVTKISKTKNKISRPIPFNTTDFLRIAAQIGFDAIKAMEIAEKLYMEGYISYPRTDNQSYDGVDIKLSLEKLSKGEFEKSAKTLLSEEINPSEGKKTKDHPPIYPVEYLDKDKLSKYEYKIYKLIVDRFFATLAPDAKVFVTKAEFDINTEIFIARGVIVDDMGWLAYYPYNNFKEESLPDLVEGEVLKVIDKRFLSKQTKAPPRYSQSTLIKMMEDLNLGTKSTRPSIIEKLYAREYISGKKQIKPSNLAKAVIVELDKYAKNVVIPDMTAKLEEEMNNIEQTSTSKDDVVSHSRDMLIGIVNDLESNKYSISKGIGVGKKEYSDFGVCTKCKSALRKMKSKKGKWFVGCSNYPQCTNSYPLPQKGDVIFTDNYCSICSSPIANLKFGRLDTNFCINRECESNKKKENVKIEH